MLEDPETLAPPTTDHHDAGGDVEHDPRLIALQPVLRRFAGCTFRVRLTLDVTDLLRFHERRPHPDDNLRTCYGRLDDAHFGCLLVVPMHRGAPVRPAQHLLSRREQRYFAPAHSKRAGIEPLARWFPMATVRDGVLLVLDEGLRRIDPEVPHTCISRYALSSHELSELPTVGQSEAELLAAE